MGDEKPSLIEFNTTSVGLNGNSDKIQLMHTILRNDAPLKHPKNLIFTNNTNRSELTKALMTVFKHKKVDHMKEEGIILMVVHPKELKEFNFCDQDSFVTEMGIEGFVVEKVTFDELIGFWVKEDEKI